MAHKVKLLGVRDDCFDLLVDGERCSYLISRPQPLDAYYVAMLRNVKNATIPESLTRASRPQWKLSRLFSDFLRLLRFRKHHVLRVVWHNDFSQVADFIERVGVEVNIDKKTKGVVLLKSDVDKIRKGGE